MADEPRSSLARALGRIPSGLFIVTTRQEDRPLGFLASFLMQVGFEPPTVSVAVGKEREHLGAIRDHGAFAVSILDKQSSGVMGAFFRKPEPGTTPFDGLVTREAPSGCLLLPDSLAWLDCRLQGEHAVGDHVVVFGEVSAAELLREGEPSIHLRADGLRY
jgi:flavin reductase (DIM6/NTAB) family NADH-FMN oxidoreductase RutF